MLGRLARSADSAVKCDSPAPPSVANAHASVANLCSNCRRFVRQYLEELRVTTHMVNQAPAHNGTTAGRIVANRLTPVKHAPGTAGQGSTVATAYRRRGRKKSRRQSHGSAWHW